MTMLDAEKMQRRNAEERAEEAEALTRTQADEIERLEAIIKELRAELNRLQLEVTSLSRELEESRNREKQYKATADKVGGYTG